MRNLEANGSINKLRLIYDQKYKYKIPSAHNFSNVFQINGEDQSRAQVGSSQFSLTNSGNSK